ncbi:hypothetical protein DENIT_11209 [Pseudomonas veronii]|nr:hypothetical protein DENIT_11209 [Pseudomonas veronii]
MALNGMDWRTVCPIFAPPSPDPSPGLKVPQVILTMGNPIPLTGSTQSKANLNSAMAKAPSISDKIRYHHYLRGSNEHD